MDVGPRTGRLSLRVLMVAGGTGGHIFPALSVADELRSRWRHCQPTRSASTGEIQFLGTRRGLESRLIPARGFSLRTVAAAALKGISGTKRLRNLLILPRAPSKAHACCATFGPTLSSEWAATWQGR